MQNDSRAPRHAWCSFCQKSYQDIGPLVEGPDQQHYICFRCVQLTTRLFEDNDRAALRKEEANKLGEPSLSQDCFCSFCGKSFRDVGPFVEGADQVYICRKCTELCARMLEGEYGRLGIEISKAPQS
jgi:ATP-dependent protease Clp ATPase subunit